MEPEAQLLWFWLIQQGFGLEIWANWSLDNMAKAIETLWQYEATVASISKQAQHIKKLNVLEV
jgi:hypothetical protein